MYGRLVSVGLLLAVSFYMVAGLDSETLTKNDKALTQFINCLLETGPCSKEEAQFRVGLPEVITTSCAKCNDAQKEFFIKTSRFVREKRPEEWKKLNNKYDPMKKNEANILKLIGVTA